MIVRRGSYLRSGTGGGEEVYRTNNVNEDGVQIHECLYAILIATKSVLSLPSRSPGLQCRIIHRSPQIRMKSTSEGRDRIWEKEQVFPRFRVDDEPAWAATFPKDDHIDHHPEEPLIDKTVSGPGYYAYGTAGRNINGYPLVPKVCSRFNHHPKRN